jgi:putative flavoprotein involved in K+ transport
MSQMTTHRDARVEPGLGRLADTAGADGATGVERFETVIVGGGQAGLALGYHLARLGREFVILEGNERIGDSWRTRTWDSLRLFTPAGHDGLPGYDFPAPSRSFPTRDALADYLEDYAARFELPVRTGVIVDRVARGNGGYVLSAAGRRFEADNVVVASGHHRTPVVPAFASELDPAIVQMHSSEYRNPSQLREGGVLLVGAGNSGADIALEVVRTHPTWLSGRDKGQIPFRIESKLAPFVFPVLWLIASRVLTVKTPIGRKARPAVLAHGAPLIRVKAKDLAAAGVERTRKTAGVKDGLPLLEDGRVLDVANVIWCTGFDRDLGWIDIQLGEDGLPVQERGVVPSHPGLYFVGFDFLYSFVSENVGGVGMDAEHIAKHIAARTRTAVTKA